MWFAAPLPPLLMAVGLAIVFGAGIVRGFAGFGFVRWSSCAAVSMTRSPREPEPAC